MTTKSKPASTKFPEGPVNLHKNNATGLGLKEAESKASKPSGGVQKDKSHGTNR